MSVAHDTHTALFEVNGWDVLANPFTLTHTPIGTPAGVMVLTRHRGTPQNIAISSVRYGPVSLRPVATARDTAGSSMRTWAWFRGSSLPPGPQVVSISHTSAETTGLWIVVCTVTSDGDHLTVVDSGIAEQDQANPSVELDSGSRSSMAYGVISSGQPDPANLSLAAGMSEVATNDELSTCARVDRQTTAAAGVFSFGYTATSEDVALVAFAIAEEEGTVRQERAPRGVTFR